jgi:hypothetical protein
MRVRVVESDVGFDSLMSGTIFFSVSFEVVRRSLRRLTIWTWPRRRQHTNPRDPFHSSQRTQSIHLLHLYHSYITLLTSFFSFVRPPTTLSFLSL